MSEEQSYEELYDKGFVDGDTGVEDLEQPLEEEDSNIVEEEDTLTEAEEETPEQEEQSTEPEEEESTEAQLYELNYKGETIRATQEELKELAQKGFDYTSKTQDLAKKREILELLGDMSPEEVKALTDAKNGDKEALSYLAKQAGVDIYDLNEESAYKPVVESRNYDLDDAIKAIQSDTENSPIIERWIDSLPSSTRIEFAKDPKILTDLHIEARNGIAQKVIPEVLKSMAMGKHSSFKEAYLSARETVVSQPTKPVASRETIKKASVPKKNVSKHTQEHTDVWNDDELYAKMQKMRRGY